MPTTRTPSNYLEEAHQIILDLTESYTKEREAQVRSLTRLAEVASGEALAKRNKPITYGSEAKAREFRDYLATGKYQRRDMAEGATGGAYPGSGSGYFSSLGFFAAVITMLKQLDDLFDEDVVQVIQTTKGTAMGFPILADENNAATIIDENNPITDQDSLMNGIILDKCPTWKTGFFASLELIQDSGVPLDVWCAAAFAVRLQRGLGSVNVTNLLAEASLAATAIGSSGNTGNLGNTNANSIGSDDLLVCVSALDAAYLASEKCAWVMNQATLTTILGTKNKQGGLVYSIDRDEDGTIYLFDIPVRISPSMPPIATGNKPIVLGDLSRFIVREVSGGMGFGVFPERGATTGQTFYRGTWRAQSALIATNNSPVDPAPAVYIQNA